MRKLTMALLLGLIIAISACGGDDNTVPNEPQQTGNETADTTTVQQEDPQDDPVDNAEPTPALPCDASAAFTFETQGAVIYMDQNMADVLTLLGEPIGVFEAPSCAFDGIDRIFRFPGIQIHTYPVDDDDFVHTISIRDDSVATQGGIFLGSSFADVVAAYGDDYDQDFGMFMFTRGRTTLSFFIEDDMVTGITYELIME